MKASLSIGILAGTPLLVLAFFFDSFSTDQGSYLMTRNWVLGQDFTGLMPFHTRPPLIGIVLLPMTWVFGDLWAGKLLSVLAMVVMGPASYFLARAWLEPKKALWATAIATLNPVIISLAIGGYLSVLALAGSFVIIRQVVWPTRRSVWILPLSAFLLVGLNQTIPANMALTLLLFPRQTWAAKWVLALGVLATAPWWPWLLVNLASGEGYYGAGTQFVFAVRQLYEWGILGPGIVLVYFVLAWRLYSPVAIPLWVSIVASVVGSTDIVINNVTARFMVYIPLWMGIHALLRWEEVFTRVRIGAAIVGVVSIAMVVMAVQKAPGFNILDDDMQGALQYLKAHSAQGDKIAGHPHGMGRWIGALTGRAWGVPWGPDAPELYREEYADLRCAVGWSPCSVNQPSQFSWFLANWALSDPVARAYTSRIAEHHSTGFAPVFEGFENVTAIVPTNAYYFIVEQKGKIWRVANFKAAERELVTDLTDQVASKAFEQGLLNLVFDRDGQGYIYYTRAGDDASVVETLSGDILVEIPQNEVYHNGGGMAWGPDGALYLGIGDGGDADRIDGWLGKILRLDVGTKNVSVYASGFRNPWRIAWGRDGLWVADVGRYTAEEINIVSEGFNGGWPESEGPGAVYTYPTTEGCAIIGGVAWQGGFVFGDFCTREVQLYKDGMVTTLGVLPEPITSFAVDGDNLLVAGYVGNVYVYTGSPSTSSESRAALELVYESGQVQVFKVLRPTIERNNVSGRTWPWEGRN